VHTAVQEGVDLLLLSGDLVDRENRYFEAFGPIEEGVRTLADAGIPVVAVAGNHDFDVLPKLATHGDAFRLLGRGGTWERFTLHGSDAPRVHVDGWSFPSEHFRGNPLDGYAPPPADGVPVIGLLHADLNQPGSAYAPVTAADLRARPPAFWVLGHVHAPVLHEGHGNAPILYPGSPQALDPGEAGPHGVWILSWQPGASVTLRRLPLSTVRYDTLDVDVTEASNADELDCAVAEAIRNHLCAVVEEGCGPLNHLSCRIRVRGRTAFHGSLKERLQNAVADLRTTYRGVEAYVDQVRVETRPAADLDELARPSGAPGLLARLILRIDRGEPDLEDARLLAEMSSRVGQVQRARPYQGLERSESAPERIHELARAQAFLLLDHLLSQKEVA
jgi:DNA repair exonuclease SbcCD nuclease subunit